ncbi:MAG: hypothetical protein HYT73_02415, partial [Candidatus Aenigmarchaeota archaeon]|nr:hypothetical protein [Candidatus Aenigmarchaeota archaeon]
MRKLLIAMIVLGIYAAVAFPQEEPRPYIPFPNPVDNDQGCYLAVVDVIGSQPELWRADQKIGDFSRGPPSLEKYYYYYDMNGFADASDYIVKTSHGSKVVTVEDGSGNCAQLPQPPPPDMEESSEPLEGVVSSGAFGTAIRTVIQIFFARPLEVSIQPTEQSTVPRSLQTIGNSLTYTLTVRNLNSFPIDARIDNPEDIAKPATLSITRAGTPLGVGRIATLAAGGELSIPLSVSSPDECPNVGESCRKDFSIKVSSYQGTRKIGDITVSAAYVLISSPPPKIRPVEGEATEKEGAINSITREGSTTEYSFYVFDDEVVNSAFIPYDVLLSQKKLSGRGTWAVSVQSPVRLEEIVQPRVDDITEIKDGMKRITVRVTPPYIAPPNDLKPGEEATFEITAKRGTIGTGSSVTIRYTVTHHGDGICDPDETTATYPQDCKAEEFFECAFGGRCERQEDNGVSFSATLNAETPQSYDFLVCDKAVSESECTTFFNGNMRNCGFDSSNNWNPKKCIGAESGLPEGENNFIATSKCADTSGGYYLLAVLRGRTPSTIRSANTYGYECPFIDIKTITEYIKNLNADKLQFQRARDAKNLEISTEENIDIKSRHVLCRDTYESIIPDISNAISLLQDLKANPSLSKASGIYGAGNDLYSWYNKFSDGRIPGSIYYRETQGCFQGRGSILQIESATFTSASIKAGDTVSVHVDVTKTGSQDYYGTVSCDITKPGERTQSIKLTPECVQMSEKKRFAAELTTANSGALVGTCTVYGSLKSDCSDATVHDQKDVSGSVYSIQYSASSVSGSNAICADATGAAAAATIPCTVTLNGNEQAKTGFAAHPKFSDASFTCARCSITRSGGETRECTFTSRNGLSSIFSCQAAGVGTYNLKGYVIDSEDCKPATPQDSQTSGKLSTDYLCYGPGDGSLTAGEECDPARTAQQTVTDCNRLGRSSPHWTCSQQSRCVDRIAPTISEMRVTAPSTLLASTNEVARCKYDEQDKPYNGMTSAETPYDTSHSWTVLGLTNTPRTLYIKCTDGTNIGTATFDASLSAACTGTAPPNALLCVGDDSGLTTGASRTLVDQCSANKCEYTCDASSGYQKQGTGCVKPNELPVINRVVMQGSCIIGNSITVSCAASDPDGTLATGSGVIKINGAAQPATFANGVYTTSTYPITQTAGTEIKATCAVTDSSRESTNLTSRLCTVQICPTAPTFNSIVMTPEEPLKGGLVEIRFTSSGALTQNPQVIITAGAIQAAAAIDLSRSSGSNYVYSARLPAYAGDATLVIRGQSEANCIGEATRPFLAVASAGAAKPSSVIITANPAAIFADGRTRSTIAATFRDANGAPMPYESSVRMSTTSGALSSMFCSTKSDESTCFTYLTSSTTPGQATVTAQWNSLSDSTSVSFLTPAPTDIYPPNIFNPKPVSGSTVQTRTQSVSIMTDEAATCSYATQPNAVSMTAMTPANGGSLHTASLILAEGANSIYFRCRDLALNENTDYPYVITYQATAGGGTACTGGAPSGTGVVKGPETYTAGYTPTSWAYDGTATTATPCKWKCDAGYGQSGSTCVQQTFSCTGTPPSNSEQCQSDSTRLTQDTPITLASSCGEPKCEYVCSSSHTKQGNQCEPLSPYVCLGQVPSNAELCSNDNTDLTQSTQITLASSCTSPKCEYICSSGYAKQGSTCISTDGTACGAGTLPASLAGVEQGPAVYTGSALSWSYQQSGDLTACKWRCGFGFAQSGNACAPAFAVGLSTTPETPLVNQQFTMDITFAGTAKLFVRGIS